MARKNPKELSEPKLIRLYQEDVVRAQRLLPSLSLTRLLRELLHAKLNEIEARLPPAQISEKALNEINP